MTTNQETHLAVLIEQIKALTESKYRSGAEEHGGDIFDYTPERLIDNAIEENIDSIIYLLDAKMKLQARQ